MQLCWGLFAMGMLHLRYRDFRDLSLGCHWQELAGVPSGLGWCLCELIQPVNCFLQKWQPVIRRCMGCLWSLLALTVHPEYHYLPAFYKFIFSRQCVRGTCLNKIRDLTKLKVDHLFLHNLNEDFAALLFPPTRVPQLQLGGLSLLRDKSPLCEHGAK